jgi:molybdopterin synthase catalytic subunit
MSTIRVQSAPFDTAAEIAALLAGRTDIGGIGCFLGTVRGTAGGRPIKSMTLEHYAGMTERALGAIANEAETRWPLLGCTIIHRIGRLTPGDPIVMVATASPHRQAALDSTAFLIDWLKTKAPFWKQEEYADGERVWVKANNADDEAANRWATGAPPLPPPATGENSAG